MGTVTPRSGFMHRNKIDLLVFINTGMQIPVRQPWIFVLVACMGLKRTRQNSISREGLGGHEQ